MIKIDFQNYYKIANRAKGKHDAVNQFYDGTKSYSFHLNMVARIVCDFLPYITEDENVIKAVVFGAYFHDTIDDARLTYNDVMKIALEFMEEKYALIATEIVYACTNEKGRNRKERASDSYYKGIRETPYAPIVKMADRIANASYSRASGSRMLEVYSKENEAFIEKVCSNSDKYIELSVPTEMINQLKSVFEK